MKKKCNNCKHLINDSDTINGMQYYNVWICRKFGFDFMPGDEFTEFEDGCFEQHKCTECKNGRIYNCSECENSNCNECYNNCNNCAWEFEEYIKEYIEKVLICRNISCQYNISDVCTNKQIPTAYKQSKTQAIMYTCTLRNK